MPRTKKRRSQKTGLPPGALVHIGEVKTPAATMMLTCIGPQGILERELTSIDELATIDEGYPLRWLNVYGVHDGELMAAIGRRFALHPLTMEDILNTDQRPKVDVYDDYLFVVGQIYDVARERGDLSIDQISMVVGHSFVLTFQERRSGTFEPIRARLRAEKNPLRRVGADYLAYTLLDAIVDAYFSVIERVGDKCEALEDEILGRPSRHVLQRVHQLKRDLSQLRRSIWPMREVIGALQRNQSHFFSEETRLYLRDVYDHAVHLLEELDDLRELLTGLLDIYLSNASNRVNLEVRTLTLLTTVFMPAALVAGIFGMNFRSMPWLDSPDGFWSALALMGVVALALFAVFWSRRLFR
ncbi:MAG TPA: magnesium/cobalt transporter CorA [Azospira sp.]|nr:magnesium/cobalt transporter CorA [Azospira sp.]